VKCLFIGRVNFKMRAWDSVESVIVLVAIGMRENSQQLVLRLWA